MTRGIIAMIGPALLGAGLIGAACAEEVAPPVSHEVEMRAFAFAPAALTVSVGDTIVWTNRDVVPHTATASNGAWDSGEVRTGASWRRVPTEAGVVEYVCAYHPSMRGTITVR